MTDPKLLDVHLSADLARRGGRIGYTGWAPTPYYEPDHWLRTGYDGCRVDCHGAILGGRDNGVGDSSLMIGHRARHVELVRARVVCGGARGILAGADSAPTSELRPLRVDLTDSSIEGPGRWGGHGYQRGGVALRCYVHDIDGEHGLWYDHGGNGEGSAWIDCLFKRIKGEANKRTYRPCAAAYPEGAVLGKHAIDDGVPWAGRERLLYQRNRYVDCGAGIVLQGGGADALVSGCVFDLDSHAIGTQDGGEFYRMDSPIGAGVAGTPGVDYGNGALTVEDCVIVGHAEANLLYLTSLESLTIRRCVILGPGVVQVGDSRGPVGKVSIENCNTPELLARAERLGYNTKVFPRLQGVVDGRLDEPHEWMRAAA